VTECNRCGDCCDPVRFDLHGQLESLQDKAAGPDPDLDPQAWLDVGWKPEELPNCRRNWVDANFILEHWHPRPESGLTCDRYDPESKLCTVHDDRPPVCRDYPWYSNGPTYEAAQKLPVRCSYRDDWQPVKLIGADRER
jgi:Fe-S-cluster containining protein